MTSLNLIDLSDNLLTGTIPERLGNAGLCVSGNIRVSNFPPCSINHTERKVTSTWIIILPAIMFVVTGILLLERCYHKIAIHSSATYEVRSFCRNTLDPVKLLEGIHDSNIIGHGGSGTVYKVITSNAKSVAVKKLNKNNTDSSGFSCWDKETKAEVMTLGGIRHTNIIKLYCLVSTMDSHLVVYEYIENGNLWDALHSGNIQMNWNTRFQIALGTAQGLAYLHHDFIPPIVHRDIKSSNILLDADYRPKIADFGIAKILWNIEPESTASGIAGTYGYLAPEYAYSSKMMTNSDVYSFGVVLLELITGRKVVESAFGESSNIADWVLRNADSTSNMMQMLDKPLAISSSDAMLQMMQIAIRCTNKSPTIRPNMKEVLASLLHIKP